MKINTNASASIASYNLGRTNQEHQRNLVRLSSGLRINTSYDDAAGLAVSMKMSAAIRRAQSYAANVENSRSFLETQDGALRQLGKLLERMSELKTLAHDVTKNAGDVLLYEKEYVQLQEQFKKAAAEEFNGVRLFSPNSPPEHLYLEHPERGDQIQVSRPTLGDLHTGQTLRVGNRMETVTVNQKTYEIIYGSYTWTEARADAEGRGGHLATITSEEEFQDICQQLPDFDSGMARVWLGGTDEGSEGNWRWITGEPWGYNRWTPGNPNNLPWEGISSQDYLWSGFAYKQLWDDTDNTARGGGG
jgi:hypothetical protein